jgi:type VI protein secretion system component VasF
MTPFDADLKKALARVEPPDGFTERLATRIAALPPRRRTPVYWRWAAVAAAAAVLFSGVSYEHERQMRGEAAKEKLLLAMRITSSKLQQAQQRIEEVESHQ